MITPIFIPMSHSSGSGIPLTPFQTYQMISCAILYLIGIDVTGFYGFSIILSLLAFAICYFLGWILLPIIVLAFLIMCIVALIQIIKERNNT